MEPVDDDFERPFPGKESAASSNDQRHKKDSTMTRLLQSCTSITRQALSCRTLAQHGTSIGTTASIDVRLAREIQTGEWLDRQVVDARASQARGKKRPRAVEGGTSSSSTMMTSSRQLQHDILDESIRQQQENLLWRRLQMSSMALQQLGYTTRDQNNEETSQHEAVLVREALKARDEQVRANLETQRRLESLQNELQEIQQQCTALQQLNRDQWLEMHKGNGTRTDVAMYASSSHHRDVASETRILKRVVQDLLLGSELDWYADPRLLKTMLRIES